jgi:sugar (pentulose or hexulose) kinase
VYNYLKEINNEIHTSLFNAFDGCDEFCRKTASPNLGLMLNSGIQFLWLKKEKPELYNKIVSILHFPQYLSYLFTKQIVAESTSIGCHTFLWDYDENKYASWLKHEDIKLPVPIATSTSFPVEFEGKTISVGVGVHDSSASLVPYLLKAPHKFLLLSTGTWCICMNPFNNEILTADQLKNDCLNYLSVQQKPVKSSRLFMGHIHDVNVNRLVEYFDVEHDSYKSVAFNLSLLNDALVLKQSTFFKSGVPENYIDAQIDLSQFPSFEIAYHQFIFDLTALCIQSMTLVIPTNDDVESIIISGGFARNEIFVRYLAANFPHKQVYTSEIDNASALGAAMVLYIDDLDRAGLTFNLGMKKW